MATLPNGQHMYTQEEDEWLKQNIDTGTYAEITARFNEKYGTTILLVTHNGVIRHMAHKVLQLKDGRIVEEYENRSRVGASDLEGL